MSLKLWGLLFPDCLLVTFWCGFSQDISRDACRVWIKEEGKLMSNLYVASF